MKCIVLFALAFAFVGASILPNNRRFEYTRIVIDNVEDNANSVDSHVTSVGTLKLLNCVNGFCDITCKMLGWNHGQCVSADTCRCYN